MHDEKNNQENERKENRNEEITCNHIEETLTEQLQAGHRSRMNGTMLQGLNPNNVQFHEVLPDPSYENQLSELQAIQEQPAIREEISSRNAEPSVSGGMPESYFNYAAQLLEQMRGVYSSSWDSCSNGSSWHGGHNHFYNPCSGADVPPNHNCPVYDCTNTCGCLNPPPQPAPCPPLANSGCSGGTATYYDDCAYKLQKVSDQLNHMEKTLNEMYSSNQQLFSYLIEYYNTLIAKK